MIGGCQSSVPASRFEEARLLVGAQRAALYLPLLKGKRVGLVVNQTSMVNNQHLVDYLLNVGVNVAIIFAPEHGFRGDHDAGQRVNSTKDPKTGIPLVSIYGSAKKPKRAVMAELDIVVFDIQDVGVRFYTFISSMHYMMEASAETGVKFMVLDRPNPNGAFIDGPLLERKYQSFVGMHPIPLLHGLTVGELALMINGQGWLGDGIEVDLKVIPLVNYRHSHPYSLPVKPSPNLPNDLAVRLYPSLALFEATPISIGRGTDYPFQVIGHDKISIGEYSFTPTSRPGSAINPKLVNKELHGMKFTRSAKGGLNLDYVINWHRAFSAQQQEFFKYPAFMDKLAGTDKLRLAITAGQSGQQIRASWQQGLNQYRLLRQQYVLYTDAIDESL